MTPNERATGQTDDRFSDSGGSLGYWWYLVEQTDQNHPAVIELFDRTEISWHTGDSRVIGQRFCPHAGADLAKGNVESAALVCPFHRFRFNACGIADSACPALPVRATSSAHGGTLVWSGHDVPQWGAPDVEIVPDSHVVVEDAVFDLHASMLEIVENVGDSGHFTSVHGAVRPPEDLTAAASGHRLQVTSRHSLGSSYFRLKVTAEGPGVVISEFGRGPWLRAVALHQPVARRKTRVRFIVTMPSVVADGRRPIAMLALPLAERLRAELLEDDEIWRHRDPSFDSRRDPILDTIRSWGQRFVPYPGAV